MKKFKEYLIEVFDKILPWEWYAKTKKSWIADFKVGRMPYDVDFIKKVVKVDGYKYGVWELLFGMGIRSTMNITGHGQAFEVFSTVGNIMKSFLKEENPDILYFSAKEKSRIKLYSALSKKIEKETGYKLVKNVDAGADDDYFIYANKDIAKLINKIKVNVSKETLDLDLKSVK